MLSQQRQLLGTVGTPAAVRCTVLPAAPGQMHVWYLGWFWHALKASCPGPRDAVLVDDVMQIYLPWDRAWGWVCCEGEILQET